MQRSDESDFETTSDDQAKKSVYDFLCHDARRVGSFLSQFEAYGVPQQVKATESETDEGLVKAEGFGEAGVPWTAKARGSAGWAAKDVSTDATERVYDPLWTNALTFLDWLTEHGMSERNIRSARIGQYVT